MYPSYNFQVILPCIYVGFLNESKGWDNGRVRSVKICSIRPHGGKEGVDCWIKSILTGRENVVDIDVKQMLHLH